MEDEEKKEEEGQISGHCEFLPYVLSPALSGKPHTRVLLSGRFSLTHTHAKSILQLLTKKTVNIPEWPSYNFHTYLIEHLWQDMKIVHDPQHFGRT